VGVVAVAVVLLLLLLRRPRPSRRRRRVQGKRVDLQKALAQQNIDLRCQPKKQITNSSYICGKREGKKEREKTPNTL
jgi:hypothetical protein